MRGTSASERTRRRGKVVQWNQGGFSLLETLVSIALTAIVVLALAAGLLTTIKSSDIAARVQVADSSLSSFAESLRSMHYPEPSVGTCPTADGVDGYATAYGAYADAWSAPDVTTEVLSIEHWDPSTQDFTSSCPATGNPHVHRLTIGVEIDGESTTGQVVVGRE